MAASTQLEPATWISRVERAHLGVVLAAVVVATVFAPRPFWAGLLAGGLVGAANLRALAFLTGRMVAADRSARHAAIGLMLVKFAALAGAVAAILRWLDPDALALLIGLTLAPASLALGTALRSPEVTR
jgi:hypothetical protein